MASRPSVPDLVAHLRRWCSSPAAQPAGFYRRHLDFVAHMSDDTLVEVVRFVKSTRGAEMALVYHVKGILHAHC